MYFIYTCQLDKKTLKNIGLESSKKISDPFESGNSSNILFLWNPYESPNEIITIEFSKNVKI